MLAFNLPYFRVLDDHAEDVRGRVSFKRGGSMGPAAMSFLRDHGVLKDIYTERDGDSRKTARGKKLSVQTVT